MDNCDSPPAKSSSDFDSSVEDKENMLEKKEYLQPSNLTKFMNKKFGMFGSIIGFYYIVQFIMCVSACN